MTSKYDADGLPIWEREDDPRDSWVHDDPVQMAFGWGCHLLGFSLPGFDRWLSSLPPCNAKTQLLGRRADALEAGRANNRELEMRHLEFMLLRMHAIQRDDALLPFARRDTKRQAGTKKPRRPEIDEWIETALDRRPNAKSPELWSDAPDWLVEQIGIDRFKKRVTKARKGR